MMTILEAIDARHSVRAYQDKPIDEETRRQLDAFLADCNQESGLNIFIRYDDPDGFDSRLAHYGSFRNVRNYIILKGKNCDDFDYLCGYYGEKIVLFAQQLGLNTCWVALTFNKKRVKELVPAGEKFSMVISLGYGETQGNPHKGKSYSAVSAEDSTAPDWYRAGVEAALKAPTAVNQQKFEFSIKDGEPFAKATGRRSIARTDLGIAAYHFETASGKKVNH
jgi:nitroreductase